MKTLYRAALLAVLTAVVFGVPALAGAIGTLQPQPGDHDELDPARGVGLSCPIGTLGVVPFGRSNHVIEHVANVCGIVGTDIEF